MQASALGVTADAQLAVLRTNGRRYIRFATGGNGDPVAVEFPSGRVVELVTRRHPPPGTVVNVALYSTSLAKFCEVWESVSRPRAVLQPRGFRVTGSQRPD